MMKILLIAYSCEPGKGSDPAVGWNWVRQIAKFNEVWVITRSNNRESIEKELERQPIENLHFEYVDLPKWARFWKKGEMGIRLYYLVWQILAYVRARKLHKTINFDISHHLTFPVDWLPAFISLLPVPFVWGPIGGSLKKFPLNFLREFGFRNSLYEVFRYLYMIYGFKLDPFVKLTRERAKIILVSTQWDRKNYSPEYREKIEVISRIGISQEELPEIDEKKEIKKFVVFTTGRLVHWKGHTLSLKAFYEFQKEYPASIFLIGGKGPEEKRLKKLVQKFKIEDKVRFLGFLPTREDVLKTIAKSDVFILPTLRDGPLITFLEVMSMGVPIICADIPGQAEIVSDDCGLRVQPGSPEQMVQDLASALKKLAEDKELRLRMGRAARERVRKMFDWNTKGEFLKELYNKIEARNQK